MKSGSMMAAQVIVSNHTGEAISTTGCGTLFNVVLNSDTYKPAPFWTTCLQQFTIPTGESTYPVTVLGSAVGCVGDPFPGDSSMPKCEDDGHPPALPPGDYQARLYQVHPLVPDPGPVPVSVTS